MTAETDALDVLGLFSHTVPEAHERFVHAARTAGAQVVARRHPLTGPDGEPLHAAVAVLGPRDARTAVLQISGTHGIEGYAGSAIQIGALRSAGTSLASRPDVRHVLVHLVNPWGAAWSRKENEANQELLRHYRYVHEGATPNPVFVDFHETIGFHRATSVEEVVAAGARMAEVVARHGAATVQAALVQGQSERPEGITYHGGEVAWSKRLLDEVVTDHLAGVDRLAVLDWHTAVGGYGEAVVINEGPDDSLDDRLARAWFQDDLWPWGEGLQPYAWIAHLLPGTEIVGCTVEIGTEQLRPHQEIIFPLDCWLHHSGRRMAPEHERHVARYRRYFYPEEPEWMASAWTNGRRRLRQLIDGVDQWAAEAAAQDEEVRS